MGDCASRPTASEIEQHIKDYNGKNDRYFKSIPYYQHHSQFLLLETNLKALESRKNLYLKKQKEFIKKYDATAESEPPVNEIIVEVQKGVYLDQPGFCFSNGKPFVAVSFEPDGPYHETFVADSYRPIWYRLIQIKSLVRYSSVKFTVRLSEGAKVIGSFEIPINELKDQKIQEKWHNLKEFPMDAPSIKVRIQYIESEKKLYQDLADTCLESSNQITQIIDKRKAKSSSLDLSLK